MHRSFTILQFVILFSLLASVVRSQTNTTYGESAGQSITTGTNNSLFGIGAGIQLTTGSSNSFFGSEVGQANTTQGGNSYFGSRSGGGATGGLNSFFGYASGMNSSGVNNVFLGTYSGEYNTTGEKNVFAGSYAGWRSTVGTRNTFVGNFAGADKDYIGSYNTFLGASSKAAYGSFTYATAIGSGSVAFNSNSVTLGRSEGEDTVYIPGRVWLKGAATGGSSSLCLTSTRYIATCSSSARYKSNIFTFTAGIELIRRLRPVTFTWNEGGIFDLGLVAEEVHKIEPLLTTTNDKGEIEGVKYDRVSVVLVNAVKEQQAQIESQQKTIEAQQKKINALTTLVCASNPLAEICKEK